MTDDDQALLDQQTEAQRLRAVELADIDELLRTKAGCRFLQRVLAKCGPLRQTFDAENPRLDALRSGERNIALWLLAEITEANPTAIGPMLGELQKPSRLDVPETR
jgi:hypothetical protein